jgi:hypothetical protein
MLRSTFPPLEPHIWNTKRLDKSNLLNPLILDDFLIKAEILPPTKGVPNAKRASLPAMVDRDLSGNPGSGRCAGSVGSAPHADQPDSASAASGGAAFALTIQWNRT